MQISLNYAGKLPVADVLALPASPTDLLWSSCNPERNRLYFGDNLPILASLIQERVVAGQVRMIYIDPPFATQSVFHSRTQTDAYQDLLAGPHYLEFIRRRLILLRELLAEDGSIYVHLDENMAFHVKVMMDEVFGAKQFRNWITRKKCNPKNTTRRRYGNIADYILFYTKTDNYVWNRPVVEWTDETAKKEYACVDPDTGRRYKRVPIHAPGTRNGATGEPWRGKFPPPGKHWQYPPAVLDEMDAQGEIYWSRNGNPRRKIFLDDSPGVPVQDIWLEHPDVRNQNTLITGYPTEKNPELIDRIIAASSNSGDLVLDCFAGSGTTLVQSARLGRSWIGMDSSAEAIATILRRFSSGVKPMGDYVVKDDSEPDNIAPTLFSELESSEDAPSNPGPDQHKGQPEIMNFALFAQAECKWQLDAILTEWQTQHKDADC